MKACEWDIACCANNHIGDFGDDSVIETLAHLDNNGILQFGAGDCLESAYRPLVVEKNGLKIAFLAFAENEFGSAGKEKPGAAPLNPVRNISHIRESSKSADITIVMVHGGNEHNPVPSPRVVDTYRAFADAGASAIIAGHTHCPQGIELWNGIPIIYSLSNFIFDYDAEFEGYNWWYGYMVRMNFSGSQAVSLQVVPHHCIPHAEKVTLLKGTDRENFFKYLNFISDIIKSPDEVEKYYKAWCMRTIDGYFSVLSRPFYPFDWEDEESMRGFMSMRNLHTCEAHNELVTKTLRIIEENDQEKAAEYMPKLNALIQGRLPC
jgi:poly-gamma-glutamate synthesis protein (capsule biosynthesis protein)